MRIFIAALIPEEIKIEIGKYVDRIKPLWEGVKWENYEKFHVTLKFLGELDEAKLEKIGTVVRESSLKFDSPFDTKITRFGGFPNLRNPRVLFVGLSQNEELSRFQNELEEKLEGLDFKKENRLFLPHVTVGRIRIKSRLKGSLPIPESNSFSISEIAVMKSVLNSRGSKYTPFSVLRAAPRKN